MFDLRRFNTVGNANDGAEMHVEDPFTGELCYADADSKLPVKICMKGMNSDDARKVQLSKIKEASKAKAKKELKRGKNNKIVEEDFDFDKAVYEACSLIAGLTTGFTNLIGLDEKPIKYTYEAALNLYLNNEKIRTQVSNFAAEDENFIKD